MKYSVFLVSIICILTLTVTLHAQISGQAPATVEVNMIPENPGPNQTVYVSIASYTTDINSASITWQVNGVTKLSGKGQKTFTFTAGDVNTTTTLSVSITTSEGEHVTKTFKIRPAGVDLMWQTESFVPPFYKGKAMFSHQNKITFIAIPHIVSGGAEIPAKNLIYKWTRNGTVMDADSGYGKNTYSFVSSLISRPVSIVVEVTGTNTNSVGRSMANITPTDPSIILYEKNPLYGIEFQKALEGTDELIDSREITVVGIPFFFGTLSLSAPELTYKWEVNGASIGNDPSSGTEVFRQREGVSGTSNISLSIENNQKILQVAGNNFNLSFGK